MYRELSLLWNPIDLQYKNKNKRYYRLIKMAVSFGIEKVNVEKKIKICKNNLKNKKKNESEKLGVLILSFCFDIFKKYPNEISSCQKTQYKTARLWLTRITCLNDVS
jgi:hypothetical protein